MVDTLEAQREMDTLFELNGVVGFDDVFAGVVQGAVANDEANAAGGEVCGMRGGQAVTYIGHADHVVGPAPGVTLERQADGPGVVDLGEGPGLAMAVVPAESSPDAEVLGQLLLPADAEAVLQTVRPGFGDIGID